jgi:hypothetical protein
LGNSYSPAGIHGVDYACVNGKGDYTYLNIVIMYTLLFVILSEAEGTPASPILALAHADPTEVLKLQA